MTEDEVRALGIKEKWDYFGGLGKQSKNQGKGLVIRNPNDDGKLIQFHPGNSTYHGDLPYWKVTSGSTGKIRFDINGKDI